MPNQAERPDCIGKVRGSNPLSSTFWRGVNSACTEIFRSTFADTQIFRPALHRSGTAYAGAVSCIHYTRRLPRYTPVCHCCGGCLYYGLFPAKAADSQTYPDERSHGRYRSGVSICADGADLAYHGFRLMLYRCAVRGHLRRNDDRLERYGIGGR